MIKKIFFSILLFVLVLSSGAVSAQRSYKTDSIAFADALWQHDTIHGLYFRHFHFQNHEIFNSNQYFCVLEIPKASPLRLAFAADTVLTRVADFARRHRALAAINGSYFNMSTGAPVCYLRVGGKELGENVPGTDTVNRKYYQNATIRLLRNGHPRFYIPDSNRLAETKIPDSNVMTAGPMLLHHGVVVPQRLDRRFVYGRHNRTAIGIKPDGTMVLFVADARVRKEADGLSLPELTRVMRWLGCRDAVNLDGGGSSTMYIKDAGEDGIVNHPSDNGRFDAAGQRRVANAILVVDPAAAASPAAH